MARVLVLSSMVANGTVGLSAARPALEALGHEVLGLPTVVLSNHPGFRAVSGRRTPPGELASMAKAFEKNGWMEGVDAVVTGYLPSADHVTYAVSLIDQLKQRGARIVVDPVLGDAPKGLYVEEAAAMAIRDHLVGRADVLTPNMFEFEWLGKPMGSRVLITSVPAGDAQIGIRDGDHLFVTAKKMGVPHGVGDVFSGLIGAGINTGQAAGYLDRIICGSLGREHLRIAQTAADWTSAPPVSHKS